MKRSPKPIRVQDAETIAAFLTQKPWGTASELHRATQIPSVTKVISAMILELKYEFAKDWKKVPRKGGGGKRTVRTYYVLRTPPKPQFEIEFGG